MEKNVLEESIKILNKIDLLKSEYVPLDNIRISKIPIGSMMHDDYGIIIPLN